MNDTYNDFTKNFFGSKMPTQEPFNFNNDYNLWQSLGYSPLNAGYDSFSKNSFSFSGSGNVANNNTNFFASKGFANAMGAVNTIGGIAGVVGGFMAARERKKFGKEMAALEREQRHRIYAREDANNKALNQGLSAFFKQKKDNL
ncbi:MULTISPECIES: hypothetical protein [unclassified Campylobacter]|uniref:hypothetical protein n=1 Tax=unclassified Campylobacter TaxID=2593542 RepID=UPI001EFAF940|nr:hypothetical protein [Campylobacter sp. RM12651]MBZ7976709.1 hypothetical protein [Campylobacter sp. RM12637]ULO02922.1 hypothetical protein AVBRAN_0452 [Campylobacter sp. RM12651]